MKRLFALLLAMTMLFGLAACNSQNEKEKEPAGTEPTGTEPEKPNVENVCTSFIVKNDEGEVWYGYVNTIENGYLTEIRDFDYDVEKKIKIAYDLENRTAVITCDSREGSLTVVWNEEGDIIKQTHQPEGKVVTVTKTPKDGGYVMVIETTENGVCTEKQVNTFDAQGSLLESLYYGNSGNLVSKYSYTYNEKGNKIRDVYEYYGEEETYTDISEYTYDENDRNILTKYIDGEGNCYSRMESSYDEDGNLLMEACYDEENTKIDWTEYTYNDKGLEESVKYYYYTDGLVSSTTYEYDDADNLIRTTAKDANGEVVTEEEFIHQELEMSEEQFWLMHEIDNAVKPWIAPAAE